MLLWRNLQVINYHHHNSDEARVDNALPPGGLSEAPDALTMVSSTWGLSLKI
jgi:hypothetical protein